MSKERKKERRRQRHERNIRKEVEYKREAWDNGKLIEENHNGNPYSDVYTSDLGTRLYQIMQGIRIKMEELEEDQRQEYAILRFRSYRKKIQDWILHYSPEVPKSEEYEYLKRLIEQYWDKPEGLWREL